MLQVMEPDMHLTALGGVMVNLHFIEYSLRFYLFTRSAEKALPFLDNSWGSLKEGDTVPVNAMTDYSTLAQLIDRFNAQAPANKRLDGPSIISLRDALAHGRATTQGGFPMRLLKFSKPANGSVTVEYSQLLDMPWLERHIDLLTVETNKLRKAIMGDDYDTSVAGVSDRLGDEPVTSPRLALASSFVRFGGQAFALDCCDRELVGICCSV